MSKCVHGEDFCDACAWEFGAARPGAQAALPLDSGTPPRGVPLTDEDKTPTHGMAIVKCERCGCEYRAPFKAAELRCPKCDAPVPYLDPPREPPAT